MLGNTSQLLRRRRPKKGKRPGSEKRSKNSNLTIDEEIIIQPSNIPAGSIFKGFKEYVVQELVTRVQVTKYRLAQWQTSDGSYVTGKLPYEMQGWHYGPELRRHIVYQHHFNRVPQQKIHKELSEKGIDISRGEIDRVLRETTQALKQEKEDILTTGIAVSKHLQTDDTGARHKGKNGYSTIVCNDLFAYFHSSDTKSRINFLKILCGKNKTYTITQETIDYALKQKLSMQSINLLKNLIGTQFTHESALKSFFMEYNFKAHEMRIITEGALIGTLISNGFPKDIVILSDDAGQFNVFDHALCWVHAERAIRKIVAVGRKERREIKKIRSLIWKYYKALQDYKKNPTAEQEQLLAQKFEEIFTKEVTGQALKKALQNIHANKAELLKVLKHPHIPLHNNTSEQNQRDSVMRRKISGGSRSLAGRDVRDIANTLIQTCFKHNISFWKFLEDRITNKNQIPFLPELILQKASLAPPT